MAKARGQRDTGRERRGRVEETRDRGREKPAADSREPATRIMPSSSVLAGGEWHTHSHLFPWILGEAPSGLLGPGQVTVRTSALFFVCFLINLIPMVVTSILYSAQGGIRRPAESWESSFHIFPAEKLRHCWGHGFKLHGLIF